MLVDSHCHLNYKGLSEDISGAISRAEKAGVGYLLSINTKIDEFPDVLATAEKYKNVACTVGIHPHEAGSETEIDVRTLVNLTKHPKVIGIGETGLDFYYDTPSHDVQERSFRIHIDAARKTQLPIIIHNRNSDERMISILNEEQKRGYFPGVIHCFSAGKELANCAIKHNMAISLSGMYFLPSYDMWYVRELIFEFPPHDVTSCDMSVAFMRRAARYMLHAWRIHATYMQHTCIIF